MNKGFIAAWNLAWIPDASLQQTFTEYSFYANSGLDAAYKIVQKEHKFPVLMELKSCNLNLFG